jgi:hypothetical protein
MSSPAATGDEDKRQIKEKNEKTDRGGDDHLDPWAREGPRTTPMASMTRQAGECLRLGLTLTEGSDPNPNQGTKIYRNLANERLHRHMIHTSTPAMADKTPTRGMTSTPHTGATPSTQEERRQRTENREPALAVEQR